MSLAVRVLQLSPSVICFLSCVLKRNVKSFGDTCVEKNSNVIDMKKKILCSVGNIRQ